MNLVPGNIEVIIYTPQELNQSSYFITGLFELEAKGKIKCRTQINFNKNKGVVSVRDNQVTIERRPHLKTSFFRVKDNADRKEVDFAIDAYDLADNYCEEALRKCKYIFKRNYDHNIAEVLMKKYPARILPLGLTFFVRSSNMRNTRKFFAGFMTGAILRSIKADRKIISRILREYKKGLNDWNTFLGTREIREYNDYEKPTQNKVVFQTRCFTGDHENTKKIHKDRNELIKALKAGLGDSFMGGFVPDDISRKNFPESLTTLPTDRTSYLKLLKSASIAIYTSGLHNSPAWKMGEYLSQGKCIVAEPLTAELPVPLEHGKNVLFFKDAEECVAMCRSLINDQDKVQALSVNSRKFYEEYVDPAMNAERIIKIVINGQ